MTETLCKFIDDLPTSNGLCGWWKQDGRETFLGVARNLSTIMSESDIMDMLGSLYNAVAAEYGG